MKVNIIAAMGNQSYHWHKISIALAFAGRLAAFQKINA